MAPAVWVRFRGWFGRPGVALAVTGVVLSTASLGGAAVLLSRAIALSDRLPVTNPAWSSPLPVNPRVRDAVVAATDAWYPGSGNRPGDRPADPRDGCVVVRDPKADGVGFPEYLPTVPLGPGQDSPPLLTTEPDALVCDGSGSVLLPSLGYDIAAWKAAGGLPAAFVPPPPWCSLSSDVSADIISADSTRVLWCSNQRPVRIPSGALDLVRGYLYDDLAARELLWGRR